VLDFFSDDVDFVELDFDFVVEVFVLAVLAFDFDGDAAFSVEAVLVVGFFAVDFVEGFFAADVEVFFAAGLGFSAVFFCGAGLLSFSASFVSVFLAVDCAPIASINTRV